MSAEDSAIADTYVAVEDTTSPAEDVADAASYPSGPYGSAVGDTVPNLELIGYVREATTGLATEAAYGAARLSDVRARTSVKYAVIHVSGFT